MIGFSCIFEGQAQYSELLEMYSELAFLNMKFSDFLKFLIFLNISRTLIQKKVFTNP